jgi:hypothetical protein
VVCPMGPHPTPTNYERRELSVPLRVIYNLTP